MHLPKLMTEIASKDKEFINDLIPRDRSFIDMASDNLDYAIIASMYHGWLVGKHGKDYAEHIRNDIKSGELS